MNIDQQLAEMFRKKKDPVDDQLASMFANEKPSFSQPSMEVDDVGQVSPEAPTFAAEEDKGAGTRAIEGFNRGFLDTVAPGAIPKDSTVGSGAVGGVGQFVGFAAAEIPIFLAGGELLAPVARRVIPKLITREVSSKYGSRAVMSLNNPRHQAEVATALGVDTIREFLGEGEFDVKGVTGEYGERIVFNLTAPFLPGLLKKPKAPKADVETLDLDLESGLKDAPENLPQPFSTSSRIDLDETGASVAPLIDDAIQDPLDLGRAARSSPINVALNRGWYLDATQSYPTFVKHTSINLEAVDDANATTELIYDTLTNQPISINSLHKLSPEIVELNSIVQLPENGRMLKAPLTKESEAHLERLHFMNTEFADKIKDSKLFEDVSTMQQLVNISLRTTVGVIERMGPAGRELAARMMATREAWHVDSGNAIADMFPALDPLPVGSLKKIARKLTGGGVPLNSAEQFGFDAIITQKNRLDAIGQTIAGKRFKSLESMLKTPDKDFNAKAFISDIARYIETNYTEVAIARNLTVKPEDMLSQGEEFALEAFAPIQKAILGAYSKFPSASGTLGKQTGETDLLATRRIISQDKLDVSTLAAGLTSHYGTVTQNLLQQIAEEGFNPWVAKAASDYIIGTGSRFNTTAWEISHKVRSFNVLTELSLAFINNAVQGVWTASRFNMMDTFSATWKYISDETYRYEAQEFARRSGAILEDMLKIADLENFDSWGGKLLQKWTPFGVIERMNRSVSAVVGRKYVTGLLEELQPGKFNAKTFDRVMNDFERLGFRRGQVEKYIDEFGLTSDGRLALGQLQTGDEKAMDNAIGRLAGFNASRVTQFLADVQDMPLVAATPLGKTAIQFKSFAINASKAGVRDFITEFGKGIATGDMQRTLPLVKMVILSATLGEVAGTTMDLAQLKNPLKRGQNEFLGFDENKYPNWFRRWVGLDPVRNDADLYERVARGIQGEWMDGNGAFIARRGLENFLIPGMFGIFASIVQSAVYAGKSGMLAFGVGPSAEKVASLADGWDATTRKLLTTMPYVGDAAQRLMDPTERQIEDNIFVTKDELAGSAVRNIARDMNDVYQEALDLSTEGKRGEAYALMHSWNKNVNNRFRHITHDIFVNRAAKDIDHGKVNKVKPGMFFKGDSFKRVHFGRRPDEGMLEHLRQVEMDILRDTQDSALSQDF